MKKKRDNYQRKIFAFRKKFLKIFNKTGGMNFKEYYKESGERTNKNVILTRYIITNTNLDLLFIIIILN